MVYAKSCIVKENGKLCGRQVLARSMCQKHYNRWKKHGDPLIERLAKRISDPVERYYSKIDKDGPIPVHRPNLGRCHLWTARPGPNGYGYMQKGRRGEGVVLAHRFGWELVNGPIPEGHMVCHHCDNPPCQRISHLFLGTQDDNMADCAEKGRSGGLGHDGQRLADDEVRAIREAYKTPYYGMRKDLAEKYGVTVNYVSAIAAGTKRAAVV
jgi:hypothetical protein